MKKTFKHVAFASAFALGLAMTGSTIAQAQQSAAAPVGCEVLANPWLDHEKAPQVPCPRF